MMKFVITLLFLCIFWVSICSNASAKVEADLYHADGETPLEYSDIMVGTQLKILIYSTTSYTDWYYGSLVLQDSNIPQAVLSADFGFSSESILPAAGDFAYIEPDGESDWYGLGFEAVGVQFGAGKDPFTGPDAGDWFLVDYNAVELGSTEINLYRTYPPEPPFYDPEFLQSIQLNHVKTRDISDNYSVGFDDFAYLADYWQVSDCGSDPNCHKVDFDDSNSIDFSDLMDFADYWLEKTR